MNSFIASMICSFIKNDKKKKILQDLLTNKVSRENRDLVYEILYGNKSVEDGVIKINNDLKKIQTDVENINYLLRATVSPGELPKASGDVRMQQEGSLVILRKITDFIKANGIQYWLDFGTLLGAVRHKGFIPWDDDVDISIPRDDYEKLKVVIPEFCRNGFSYSEGDIIRIFYKNTKAQVDIFPYDSGVSEELPVGKAYDDVIDRIVSLYKKIPWNKPENYRKGIIPKEYMAKVKNIIDKDLRQNKNVPEKAYMHLAYHCFSLKRVLYSYEDIFPLKETEFEGLLFSIPNKKEHYLHKYYGDFMALPDKCASRHPGMIRNITTEQLKEYQELIGLMQ